MKYSFSQRIINDWNSLPQIVVQSKNLNSFKSGIDSFLTKIYDIGDYNETYSCN